MQKKQQCISNKTAIQARGQKNNFTVDTKKPCHESVLKKDDKRR